jgi:uncharacterized protein (DUF1697 family)
MTTYIGLLRAINLAGLNKVAMADLREMLTGLGFDDVKTLLQSGNVVFRGRPRAMAGLEKALEGALRTDLGVTTDFFVRSVPEWDALVAANPFPKEAQRDPQRLIALVLRDAPDQTRVKDLQKAIVGREVVRAEGRQAYIVYPDGMGRSRLSIALIEKKLGTRGTARNWNTVLKLQAIAAG